MDPAYAPYAYSPYIINSSLQKKKNGAFFGGEDEVPPLENKDNSESLSSSRRQPRLLLSICGQDK